MNRLLFFLFLVPFPGFALLDEPDAWFFGLLRHVDQWYLSDLYHFEPDEDESITVRIIEKKVPLLKGDQSRFFAVEFPEIHLYIVLKQSDYHLDELDITVHNTHPKVVSVKRYSGDSIMPADAQVRLLSETNAEQMLYEERSQSANLSPELRTRLRNTFFQQILDKNQPLTETQTFFVSPISPYSNTIYIYWLEKNQILLLRSGADIDTAAFCQLLPMGTTIIDLHTDVVTNLNLVSGSNAYVTKAWAARILFHCIAEGEKFTIIPNVSK